MYIIDYYKYKSSTEGENREGQIQKQEFFASNPVEKDKYLEIIKRNYSQYGKVTYQVDFNKLKEYVAMNLAEARDQALATGFVVNGTEYGFNSTDQTNMAETLNIFNAKILQAMQKDEPIENIKLPYKAKSIGEMTLRTFDEFMEIVDAATAHKVSIWEKYTQKMIELQNAISEKEVLAVKW